jgi:hypothetical protein
MSASVQLRTRHGVQYGSGTEYWRIPKSGEEATATAEPFHLTVPDRRTLLERLPPYAYWRMGLANLISCST